jgi:hypothetical protein
MVGGEGEDPLLCHGALHVVVLDDHVLLQNLRTDTNYDKKSSNAVLWIRDILLHLRIRILQFSSMTFKSHQKTIFFKKFLKVHLHHIFPKIKVIKKSQNSRNQSFSYYF